MAKFKFTTLVDVNGNDIKTCKFDSLHATDADNDIGKPVKLHATVGDCYELCSDGDEIEGFIHSIEPATVDGKVYGTVQTGGRKRCEAEGASTLGALVEAGAVAASGTAEGTGLPQVSTHAEDDTTVTTLMNTTFKNNWRIISATRVDGTVDDVDTNVIIERL